MRSADPGVLLDDDWDRHQEIIARFESAWKRGERPKIGHYLPADEPSRDALLVELVHADLEFRLKAGEPARVEDYLREYPDLDRAATLDLIRAERAIRRQTEPRLGFDRYRSRFPDLRAELQTPAGEASTIATPVPRPADPPGPSPAADRPLPRRFGKFELRQRLGEGAFGVVYRAWDTVLKREVAVKLPRDELATVGPELAVFLRDARNSHHLRHPNIVEILDAGPIDGVDCMVRAYIEGETLAERLRRGPFSPREAASLVRVVAGAIDYAHGRGIIHRDLKPSNLLIDLAGRPHVMDFGLAKREDGGSTLSPAGAQGMVIGTPAYMSPEQARGATLDVDARSDVYALGVVLYEMLTGSVPFRGRGRMLQVQIQEAEPIPPRELNDEVPADLDQICRKALAKEASGRYPTAGALADDLGNFLEGRAVGAKPAPSRRRRPWKVRWRSILAVAAVLAALAGLAGTTSLWLRAEARRARDSRAVERTLRDLLELAGAGDPDEAGPRGDPAGRAAEAAERLLPALEGDPLLLELAVDARLRLAERASAEGSDRVARPRWERAVLACESSLRERPVRPSRIADLAGACLGLAQVRRRAGEREAARDLFDRSIGLLSVAAGVFGRRAEEDPADEGARLGRAECLLRLAEARSAIGRMADVDEVDEVEAVALRLEHRSRPGTPDFDRRLGRLMLDLSRRQLAEGRPRPAEEWARKGLRLRGDGGPEVESSFERARVCLAIARSVRDPYQATGKAAEAVGLLRPILASGSARPGDRRLFAEALFESARLLDRSATRRDSIDRYRAALRVLRQLDEDHPRSHETAARLGQVRAGLSRALEGERMRCPSVAHRLLATLDQARAVSLAPGEGLYWKGLAMRAWELVGGIRAGIAPRAMVVRP